MVEEEGKKVYVREQWVYFCKEKINNLVQSEGAKIWLKVQETTKGARVPKNSRPTYSWKRKMEGDKENPL